MDLEPEVKSDRVWVGEEKTYFLNENKNVEVVGTKGREINNQSTKEFLYL